MIRFSRSESISSTIVGFHGAMLSTLSALLLIFASSSKMLERVLGCVLELSRFSSSRSRSCSERMALTHASAAFAASGTWTVNLGKLVVPLEAGQSLVPDSNYTFAFQVLNPAAAQVSPAVSVSASANGEPAVVFAAVAMDKDESALGYGRSAAPLEVATPAFAVRSIVQSNPYPGASNSFTVSLASTVDLIASDTSRVTITGLTASSTAGTSAALAIASDASNVDDIFGGTASWTLGAGSLVFTVESGKTMAGGVLYVYSFVLTNTESAQSAVSVSVSASGTATIAPVSMTTNAIDHIPGLAASTPGDLLPQKTMAKTFLLKRIGQSTTYPGATNTLTVSLVSTANLAGHDSSSLVITFASQGLSMTPALTDVPLQEGVFKPRMLMTLSPYRGRC